MGSARTIEFHRLLFWEFGEQVKEKETSLALSSWKLWCHCLKLMHSDSTFFFKVVTKKANWEGK